MTEELAKPPPPKRGPKADLKSLLESDLFRNEVQKALPDPNKAEAFIRAALTAAIRTPGLYKVKPDSLWQCLFDLAQLDLYPDGRRAHLIPFGDQCQLIIDYKGIAELARRNGDVVYIHCDVVHSGERYVCQYGTNGRLEHIPDPDCEDNPIRFAYSFVKFRIPGSDMLVEEYTQMSAKAIQHVRDKSAAKNKGPWVTDFAEMAKKTVFRRHAKTLSLSPQTRKAVEYGEDEEFRFRNAVPAEIPKRDDVIDVEDNEEQEGGEAVTKPPPKPPKTPKKAEKVPPSEPEPKKEVDNLLFDQSEEAVAKSMSDRLDMLIRESNVNKAQFFDWLNARGVKHVRDPKLKILTYVDLAPSDLEILVEHWEANLDAFKHWTKESNASPF